MNVWLLTIGEPVPVGAGCHDRLHRTGAFARYLASNGHRVDWWTSTFDHFRKEHLTPDDAVVTDIPGLRIRLLRGRGYARNLSVARVLDHAQIARKFASLSRKEAAPDIVVSALPTVDLCLAAVNYAVPRGVPCILDLRDMWPDIIADAAPAALRPVARLALAPLFHQARRACRRATALTGITEAFVDWGLRRGGRERSEFDRAFPFTYSPEVPQPEETHLADAFWDAQGVCAEARELTLCYFGNMGLQLDLSHVVEAARQTFLQRAPVRFVLCGQGERLEEYRKAAAGLPNIQFPGWMNRARILALMRRASIGLDPLPERYDYLATVNNKAVEYISAGLPVLSSPPRGVLCGLLQRHDCGLSYAAGDAASLGARLSELAANPARVRQMGANASALFAREFSTDSVHPAMAAYLQFVREGCRAKAADRIPGLRRMAPEGSR